MRRVRPVRRAPSTRNWAPRAAGALDAPGPLGGSARDRCACSHHRGSRTADGRRSALGLTRSPGRVDDPLAQGRIGVQLADLGAGQPRPGRGLRRRPAVDPVRAGPAADLAGHGLPAPADPAGDEGGRIPLRQARGDHGPLTGPQAQAPTGAPRHPRVGSPVIRWPPGAPAPPSAQDLTAMRPLDGGNGAGGGAHTRIVQPPARGRDRHAPGPGGPGPPGPSRPRASNTARLRRAAARALPPTAPIASPTPAPRAHRCTAVCDTPSSRAAAHADQPSAISSIARRRTSSATLTPRGTSITPPNP